MSQNKAQRLSGINPLSYLGVEPITPPLLVINNIAPTSTDVNGFYLGTLWVVTPLPYTIWILVSVAQHVATWVQIYPQTSAGGILKFTAQTGANPVLPDVTGNVNLSGAAVAGGVAGLLTTGGAANTVDFIVSGDVAAKFLTDDTNVATPALNVLTVTGAGSGVITTKSPGSASTVDINFTPSTNGQIIIGHTGGTPAWSTITAGANIVITNGANSIMIAAAGAGGGGAVNFPTDVGTASEAAGVLNILAATASVPSANINTTGSGNTVAVYLNNSLLLPTTTADELNGVISINGNSFMHSYRGASNVFLGNLAGNFTMGASALKNTGIGDLCLNSLTVGSSNTTLGELAGSLLTSGSNNICLGVDSGVNYTTEDDNVLISHAGIVSDANTIRIGTQGAGNGQQNKAFMAGVAGVSVANLNFVTVNTATGQLGSQSVSPGAPIAGTQAFSAYLATGDTQTVNIGGLNYNMGTTVAYTPLFDPGANFTTGGLTGCFYTAPISGIYQFIWQLYCSRGPISTGTTGVVLTPNMNMVSTQHTYVFGLPTRWTGPNTGSVSGAGDAQQAITWSMTILAPMNAGDTMQFNLTDSATAKYFFRGADVTGNLGANFLQGYRIA